MSAWKDTGVCIVQSRADPRIWSAMVPNLDMASVSDSASGFRKCKAWVERNHRHHVYVLDDPTTPTRWVRVNADLWEWQFLQG